MVLVMVGAMLVTGIETAWRCRSPIARFETIRSTGAFSRGQELGRFTFGSTLVVLFPRGSLQPEPGLRPDQLIRIGEPLGRCLRR
jgi:phosphatidylserine decarboxylase